MESTWTEVDDFFAPLVQSDGALIHALADSDRAGLPPISVTPAQGKLLFMLARLRGARRILEVGTLGGYSTIWMARALPDGGKLITLEIDARHADVARQNLTRAKVTDRVEILVAPASDSLAKLIADQIEPFDFVFIDADKVSTPQYFDAALRLSHSGTIILVDNVVRKGAVLDAATADPSIQGMRAAIEMIAREPRVVATAIQTVGAKGYDGFIVATVT